MKFLIQICIVLYLTIYKKKLQLLCKNRKFNSIVEILVKVFPMHFILFEIISIKSSLRKKKMELKGYSINNRWIEMHTNYF